MRGPAHLALLIFFVFSPCNLLGENCVNTLRKAFETLLEETKSDPLVYQPQYCAINSGELIRKFNERFGGDPNISIKDLNLLIVRNKNLPSIYEPAETVDSKRQIQPALRRDGSSDKWNYHVVLEFKGDILDLDLKWSQVPPLKVYLKMMFPKEKYKNLLVTRLPASYYLKFYPTSRPAPRFFIDLTDLPKISTTTDMETLVNQLSREKK